LNPHYFFNSQSRNIQKITLKINRGEKAGSALQRRDAAEK